MSKANVDRDEMSRLVKAAMGDRTYREYAGDSGVDAAIISKIINKKYTPGVSILQKLSSDEAKPQNGVTFDSFMGAYSETDYQSRIPSTIAIASTLGGLAAVPVVGPMMIATVLTAGVIEGVIDIAGDSLDIAGGAQRIKQKASQIIGIKDEDLESIKKKASKFKALSIMLIADSCNRNGIKIIGQIPSNVDPSSTESIEIDNGNYNRWRLTFIPLQKTEKKRSEELLRSFAQTIVSQCFFKEEEEKTKESIVTNDEELYGALKSLAGCIAYRGTLSVILVDADDMSLKKECILSVYPKGNNTFVITN